MEQAASIFGIVILGLLVLLPMVRPQLAIVSWLMLFPLNQLLQSSFAWFMNNNLFANAVIGGSVVVAAARMIIFGGVRPGVLFNYAFFAIVGLLLYALASIVWSANQPLALEFVGNRGPYTLLVLLILPLTIRDIEVLREARWWILVFGSAIALCLYGAGTFRFYGNRMVVMLGGANRGNPLALAELGGIMFVLGVLSRDAPSRILPSLVRLFGALLGIGLIISSGSRGQLVAAVFASLICFPFAAPLRNVRAAVATVVGLPLVILTIYAGLSIFVGDENWKRWSSASLVSGSEDRLSFLTRYFAVWAQSPTAWIFGFGTLSFEVVAGGLAGFVENLAAEILFEEGVAAFFLFVSIWIVLFRRVRSSIASAPEDVAWRSMVMTATAIVIFFLIVACKSYCVWSAYPLWLWLCLTFRIVDSRSPNEEPGQLPTFEGEGLPPDLEVSPGVYR
jgi:hypothetical protein